MIKSLSVSKIAVSLLYQLIINIKNKKMRNLIAKIAKVEELKFKIALVFASTMFLFLTISLILSDRLFAINY